MHQVGIRELKNKLTHYLRIARQGEAVIITDRGEPVAVLHSLESIEDTAGPEERLAQQASLGLVRLPKASPESAFPSFERVAIQGEPLSETIRRERR